MRIFAATLSNFIRVSADKMYRQTCTDLLHLPKADVQTWLSSFDTVLTDCDGVLWIHANAIDGSPAVINKFKEIGKKVFFLTNNSTKTRDELAEKAIEMKFNIQKDNIISTAFVAAKYLQQRNFNKKVYVVGSTGITRELDALGIRHTGVGPDVLQSNLQNLVYGGFQPDDDVGAVIVGFDEHFSFPKMFKAATYLERPGCLFIGTNTDERFPMTGCVIPGTGSMVRSIEVAAGRNCELMGKPNPFVCEALIAEHNIVPERTLMIGDRCNTDILLGTNCGFHTLLVGTGIHQLNDVDTWQSNDSVSDKKLIPDVFVPRLGDLLQFM